MAACHLAECLRWIRMNEFVKTLIPGSMGMKEHERKYSLICDTFGKIGGPVLWEFMNTGVPALAGVGLGHDIGYGLSMAIGTGMYIVPRAFAYLVNWSLGEYYKP